MLQTAIILRGYLLPISILPRPVQVGYSHFDVFNFDPLHRKAEHAFDSPKSDGADW